MYNIFFCQQSYELYLVSNNTECYIYLIQDALCYDDHYTIQTIYTFMSIVKWMSHIYITYNTHII